MKTDRTRDDPPPYHPRGPLQPLPAELCEHVGFLLGKARQELVGRLDPIVSPLGLTIRHFGVLLLLLSRGAMRQTELSDAIRLDRTSTMHMVDELERAGLVRREADPRDRRANAVKPTARGKTWLEKIRPRAEAAEREFLAPLSDSEQEQLRTLLTRLVAPGVAR